MWNVNSGGFGDAVNRQILMMQISMQIDADLEWMLWNINAGGCVMLLLGKYQWCKYQCKLMHFPGEYRWEYLWISMYIPGEYWFKYRCRYRVRLQKICTVELTYDSGTNHDDHQHIFRTISIELRATIIKLCGLRWSWSRTPGTINY